MRRGRPPYPDLLTPREQEVLALIRDGLTNEQIAARLGISESGARYHVSEILSKLGVSSRTEAALWRGDERSRVPALVPLLARLGGQIGRGPGRPWAIAGVAVAAVAFLALAIGVVVNETRGNSLEQAAGPAPTPGPELSELQEWEAEANRIAAVVTPDGYLYQMMHFWGPGAELYTFFYTRPGGFVAIGRGPVSEQEMWTITTADADQFAPAPLELSRVVHAPQDVYAATASRGGAPPEDECVETCLALLLEADPSGTALWHITGLFQNNDQVDQVNCQVDDSGSLGSMTCGAMVPPWPTSPAEQITPSPALTADGVRELTELALRLTSIFEPEVYLFSLRAQVEIAAIPTGYLLGFATPDGSTRIRISGHGARLQIEVNEDAGQEPQPRLDLTSLQKGPDEVAQAAEDEANIRRAEVNLLQEDERLVWEVTGRTGASSATTCSAPDAAPLTDVACEVDELTPTPGP